MNYKVVLQPSKNNKNHHDCEQIAVFGYFSNDIQKTLWQHVPNGNGRYGNFRLTFLLCLKYLCVKLSLFFQIGCRFTSQEI